MFMMVAQGLGQLVQGSQRGSGLTSSHWPLPWMPFFAAALSFSRTRWSSRRNRKSRKSRSVVVLHTHWSPALTPSWLPRTVLCVDCGRARVENGAWRTGGKQQDYRRAKDWLPRNRLSSCAEGKMTDLILVRSTSRPNSPRGDLQVMQGQNVQLPAARSQEAVLRTEYRIWSTGGSTQMPHRLGQNPRSEARRERFGRNPSVILEPGRGR